MDLSEIRKQIEAARSEDVIQWLPFQNPEIIKFHSGEYFLIPCNYQAEISSRAITCNDVWFPVFKRNGSQNWQGLPTVLGLTGDPEEEFLKLFDNAPSRSETEKPKFTFFQIAWQDMWMYLSFWTCLIGIFISVFQIVPDLPYYGYGILGISSIFLTYRLVQLLLVLRGGIVIKAEILRIISQPRIANIVRYKYEIDDQVFRQSKYIWMTEEEQLWVIVNPKFPSIHFACAEDNFRS